MPKTTTKSKQRPAQHPTRQPGQESQMRPQPGDAEATAQIVREEGTRCLLLPGDVGDRRVCDRAVAAVVAELGRLDILVNNAAEQHVVPDLLLRRRRR